MPSIELVLMAISALSASGFVLKYFFGFKVSRANLLAPPLFALLGVTTASQLRDFSEASTFLLIVTGWFTAQIFSSRLRQRSSFFWNIMGGIAVNGSWFIAVQILDKAEAYWLLMIPYVFGVLTGRVAGVNWAIYVEKKYELKADATKNSDMAPGERWNYIKREPSFWVLLIGLALYTAYGCISFGSDMRNALLVVIVLGLLQNLFYALKTRAGNRGNNWYIANTGILSGVTFYVSAAYIFSKGVPIELFIPYVISTSLGTALGAFFSMIIEWIKKLKPDAHIDQDKIAVKKPHEEYLPYLILIVAGVVWISVERFALNLLGYQISQLEFPLTFVTGDFPRTLVMIAAALLFFIQDSFHSLNSRAGNRNHTGYHVATIIPYGLLDFLKLSYISLNNRIPELVPIAVIASCLGSLYGKDISKKIEIWLQARMDVEPEKPKSKPATE